MGRDEALEDPGVVAPGITGLGSGDLVRFLKGSLKGSIGFLKGIYRV